MKPDTLSEAYPVPSPLLIVVSGMSGVGKDSVLNGLKQSKLPLEFIVTMTTRKPRSGEENGVHYTFVSEERFRDSSQKTSF
jgi:guanylate kinase